MPDMVYLNFDIEIEKANGEYRAHVLSSPAGEARAAVGPLDGTPVDASPETLGGESSMPFSGMRCSAACVAASM